MLRTLGSRLALLIPMLFLVTVGTFLLVNLVPGDPAVQVLGSNATPEDYVRVHHELGLDRPIVQRYGEWLGGVVRGDFGKDLVPPVEKVSARLRRAFPVNLELAAFALVMAFGLSIPLALWSAYRAGSRFDRLISAGTFASISIPSFLLGLLLVLVFAVNWRLFPLGQWARPTERGWPTNLRYAFLPAFTLAAQEAPVFTRLLRSDMLSTLQEDYILAAKAKGMRTWHILLREALRPSSFSLVTLAGVRVGSLIGGTVIVEQVFSLPGMGRAIIDAANKHDYKLVQAGVLLIAIVFILVNLFVDLLYRYLDPRIRRAHA